MADKQPRKLPGGDRAQRSRPPLYVLATATVSLGVCVVAGSFLITDWNSDEPGRAERMEARWEAQERAEAADPFLTEIGYFDYVYDPKGDLCFAIRHAETTRESMTRVPCTKRIRQVIEGEADPEPASLEGERRGSGAAPRPR